MPGPSNGANSKARFSVVLAKMLSNGGATSVPSMTNPMQETADSANGHRLVRAYAAKGTKIVASRTIDQSEYINPKSC